MTRRNTHRLRLLPVLAAVGALYGLTSLPAQASSHREAPFITTAPKVDGTDFYMFRSYESARMSGPAYVTLIANYLPLQDAYGGPNYFKLDGNALYEIHIDNTGNGKEDITFQFRFTNTLKSQALPIGGKNVPIPLTQSGQVTVQDPSSKLNVTESYTLNVVRGDRRTGQSSPVMNGSSPNFVKPSDNIGTKTIPNYAAYVQPYVYTVNIPGCTAGPGKVFVGQRKDPFAINLGVIFDLVNVPGADFSPAEVAFITNPANNDAGTDDLKFKNVTTLALEVPAACLTNGNDPVIGGWTTASLRQGRLLSSAPKSGYQTSEIVGGAWTQVSRLGNPLINEVIIGLPDKDKFNSSKPADDGMNFADYVTNPTLPALIGVALGNTGIAPTNIPRNDLVVTFLSGIAGVNQPAAFGGGSPTGVLSEEMRLNTSIPAQPIAMQNRLGLLGAILAGQPDRAGYPNGRRPNDDIVDISLIAAMGGLCQANGANDMLGFGPACSPTAVPLGATVYNLHDGVDQAGPKVRAAGPLLDAFPYLGTPLPGASN